MKSKVLYVLHNHPALVHGGSEAYTMNVYEAIRQSGEFEPMLVARATRAAAPQPGRDLAARFAQYGDDPNQFLMFVEEDEYDKLFMRSRSKSILTRDFDYFLRTHRPDVVHIQQTLFIGSDLISAVRRALPEAAIACTLHEYLPICNHYGQLLRTNGRELCLEASPRRCNECFPEITPQTFFLRKEFILGQYSQVDLFIAPSRFLLERYVDWGIPRERIRLEEHGFPPVAREPEPPDRPRNRFAFFGVMTPFKGVEVLLRAMHMLGPEFEGRAVVHGANYEAQPEDVQAELERLFEATRATVTHAGPYDHEADLPRLMAETDWVVVPSIWWENSPLVIQEAFLYGRPVICSGIGGMAEKVANEVNGLHFGSGNPESLAATLRRAAGTPGLWERLRAGIGSVRTIEEHVGALATIYREQIEARRSIAGARPAARGAGG
jgi:glycosyltransferase involved in cell wall biosynthesis